VVLDACVEVRGAVVYGSFTVMLVIMPVFFLTGLAGSFFRPLAMAYVLATFASLVVALTVTPAMSLLLLPGRSDRRREAPLVTLLKRPYRGALPALISRPSWALAGLGGLLAATLLSVPFLGEEFLPKTFGREYPKGPEFLSRLSALERGIAEALSRLRPGELGDYEKVAALVADFDRLKREALLANPLLDFEQLLLIKRVPDGDPRRPIGTGYGVGEYIGLPRQSSKSLPGHRAPVRLGQRDRRPLAGVSGGQAEDPLPFGREQAGDRRRPALGR